MDSNINNNIDQSEPRITAGEITDLISPNLHVSQELEILGYSYIRTSSSRIPNLNRVEITVLVSGIGIHERQVSQIESDYPEAKVSELITAINLTLKTENMYLANARSDPGRLMDLEGTLYRSRKQPEIGNQDQ
jgi:hypothetical protein